MGFSKTEVQRFIDQDAFRKFFNDEYIQELYHLIITEYQIFDKFDEALKDHNSDYDDFKIEVLKDPEFYNIHYDEYNGIRFLFFRWAVKEPGRFLMIIFIWRLTRPKLYFLTIYCMYL